MGIGIIAIGIIADQATVGIDKFFLRVCRVSLDLSLGWHFVEESGQICNDVVLHNIIKDGNQSSQPYNLRISNVYLYSYKQSKYRKWQCFLFPLTPLSYVALLHSNKTLFLVSKNIIVWPMLVSGSKKQFPNACKTLYLKVVGILISTVMGTISIIIIQHKF